MCYSTMPQCMNKSKGENLGKGNEYVITFVSLDLYYVVLNLKKKCYTDSIR